MAAPLLFAAILPLLPGAAPHPAFVLAGVIVAWTAADLAWRGLRSRNLPPAPAWVHRAMAFKPDPAYRLRLIAGPRKAAALITLADDPFEPRFFTSVFALPPNRLVRSTLIIASIAAWVAVLTGLFKAPGTGLAGSAVLLAILIALWCGCPTYLRISPGRLDLIRSVIWSRTPRITTLDLLTTQVQVDLKRDLITIIPAGEAQPRLLETRSILDHVGLARAIFEAARARAPGPPLPDDALTG